MKDKGTNKFVLLMAVLLTVLLVDRVDALMISSTFDTDADGWVSNSGGSLSYVASGGNPGGFIQIADAGVSPNYGVIAPGKFLGDLSAFDGGQLVFDLKIIDQGNGGNQDNVGPRITNGIDTASFSFNPNQPSDWKKHSVPLTASAWGLTQLQWIALLSNVTEIQVFIELFGGDDITGFDNFKLTSIPEPATMLLFGSGLIGLAGLRKRFKPN